MTHTSLEQLIGYSFKSKAILERALTHASKSSQHLERQEFLGDAVLGLTIAEHLFEKYPDISEGDLSKMRAKLVCKPALMEIAKVWKLSTHLLVGEGERSKQGTIKSKSIEANAVESVIGAIFQDGGWEQAKMVVLRFWEPMLKDVTVGSLRDAKSKLQELTQAHGLGLPTYEVFDAGVNQTPRFKASCYLKGVCLGSGHGNRKKEAESSAAESALESNTLQALF